MICRFPAARQPRSSEVALGISAHVGGKVFTNPPPVHVHNALFLQPLDRLLGTRARLAFLLPPEFVHFGVVIHIHIGPG